MTRHRFGINGPAVAETDDSQRDDLVGLLARLQSRRAKVRRVAVEELARSPGPRALPALESSLRDPNTKVAKAAAVGLREGGSQAQAALHAALSDEDEWVRLIAAWAIAQRGDLRAIPVLIESLGHADWDQHPHAIEALTTLGPEGMAIVETVAKDPEQSSLAREVAARATALHRDGNEAE
jgi:HEAT repeat protein